MNLKQLWVWAIVLVMLSLGGFLYYEKETEARPHPLRRYLANGRVSTSTMLLFSIQNSPVRRMSREDAWNVIRRRLRIS